MTIVWPDQQLDPLLAGSFIAHLDTQLESARRLHGLVLEQGAAIRRRDVQNVVRLAGALQVEMHRREVIEAERTRLLRRVAGQLRMDAAELTLSGLTGLMDPESAHHARERSSELTALLAEIQREHETNRALMQQELAFLDHLLRLAGQGGSGAYQPGPSHPAADRNPRRASAAYARRRVFDLEA